MDRFGVVGLVVYLWLLCGAAGYLNRKYTSDNAKSLLNVILESQSDSGLFENSLSSSFYATDALTRLNEKSSDSSKLCSTLQNFKPSSWEEFKNLLLTRSRVDDCLRSITDKTRDRLINGLTEKKLSHVFYAVDAVSALVDLKLIDASQVDVDQVLQHISTFQNSKDKLFGESQKSAGSVYRSSLALLATTKLLSIAEPSASSAELLKTFAVAAKAVLGKHDVNPDFLSYSNSLTATSHVIESVDAFLQTVSKFESVSSELKAISSYFNDAVYVEKLVRYVLSYIGTSNVVTARHILILMDIIQKSSQFGPNKPLTVTFDNNVFGSNGKSVVDGKRGLTISISDVFDNAVLSADDGNTVVVESSKEVGSKLAGPKGAFAAVKGSDFKQFEYNFGQELFKYLDSNDKNEKSEGGGSELPPKFGIYNLLIHVNGLKVTAGAPLSVRTDAKVLTKLGKIEFGAALAKEAADKGFEKAKFPDGRISRVLEISPSEKAKFEITVKSAQRPTYIAVQFVDANGQVVVQAIPRRRQDKYALSIDVSKKTYSKLGEGRYTINLVVSDALYEGQGIHWQNIMEISTLEEMEDMEEKDYEPIDDETPKWAPKENIEHTFQQPEETSIGLITTIFTALVWAPFVLFVFTLFTKQKLSCSCQGTSSIMSLLFLVSLGGVVATLTIYWLGTNIFRASGYVIIATIPLYFFMYRILKGKMMQRMAKQSKSD